MTSNNMKTAADTSRLMSVIATLAIAIALYFGCSFLIWQGSRWADQVGSSWPLLGALAIIIGGLLATAICGKRGTSHEAQAGPWRVALRRVSTAAGSMLALLVVVMIFGIADWWQHDAGKFLSLGSLRLVAVQGVMIAVAALGMTMVIIAGGIDLSAGTSLALSGTVVAYLLKQEMPIGVALLGGVLCGSCCGMVNGSLISLLKLVPFIITLGTMTIFLGLGKMLAGEGGTITPPYGSVPEWLEAMVTQSPSPTHLLWPLVPNFAWGVWLAIGLAVLVAVLLHNTVFGRHLFAIGSNEATARLCGIPVARTKILIYMLSGLCIGIAGIYHFARLTKGDATAGLGLELRVIAAVVIGGGSLSGGRGSVIGTLCGAAIMTVISHGCTALGLENQVEDILLGVIIVAAVSVDRLRTQQRA